jgi:hypothetical protein
MAHVIDADRSRGAAVPWAGRAVERIVDASLERLAAMPPATAVRALLEDHADRLPLPGHGDTLSRWRVLARVAAHDLALVKLFEGHTDAVAILSEIDPASTVAAGTLYGVWASESRVDPMTLAAGANGAMVEVSGRKSWCSGAAHVDRALMTAVDTDGGRHLIDIAMNASGVSIDRSRWHAVGMQGSESFDVICDRAEARVVGGPRAYLDRPGFWHGGAGIAACWHGAAAAVGRRVQDLQRGRDDVHALAHLGAIDGELAAGAALLRECAAAIDADPQGDAMHRVLRVRNTIADIAERVLDHAARALGPGPLCNEPDLAQRFADLPIFVRQSRADHDRVAAARALLASGDEGPAWTL